METEQCQFCGDAFLRIPHFFEVEKMENLCWVSHLSPSCWWQQRLSSAQTQILGFKLISGLCPAQPGPGAALTHKNWWKLPQNWLPIPFLLIHQHQHQHTPHCALIADTRSCLGQERIEEGGMTHTDHYYYKESTVRMHSAAWLTVEAAWEYSPRLLFTVMCVVITAGAPRLSGLGVR